MEVGPVKRAQISLEYIMVIAFTFAIIIPGIYFFYTYSQSSAASLSAAQYDKLGQEMITSAVQTLAQGKGSYLTLDLLIPGNVENITVSENGNELIITYMTPYGPTEAVFFSDEAPLKGLGNPDDNAIFVSDPHGGRITFRFVAGELGDVGVLEDTGDFTPPVWDECEEVGQCDDPKIKGGTCYYDVKACEDGICVYFNDDEYPPNCDGTDNWQSNVCKYSPAVDPTCTLTGWDCQYSEQSEPCYAPGENVLGECWTGTCSSDCCDSSGCLAVNQGTRPEWCPSAFCDLATGWDTSSCGPDECGDAGLDPGEFCDDGNTLDGDGCSYDCKVEPMCVDDDSGIHVDIWGNTTFGNDSATFNDTCAVNLTDLVYTPQARFGDVPATNWAEPAITLGRGFSITAGCGTDIYCPAQNITRAETAAFLYAAFQVPEYSPGTPTFADVPTEYTYFVAIESVYHDNIMEPPNYKTPLRFRPDWNINRSEFVASVVKARGILTVGCQGDVFNDVDHTNSYCAEIEAAYEHNITTGCGSGNFCPRDNVTRDTAMVLIVNALLNRAGNDCEGDSCNIIEYGCDGYNYTVELIPCPYGCSAGVCTTGCPCSGYSPWYDYNDDQVLDNADQISLEYMVGVGTCTAPLQICDVDGNGALEEKDVEALVAYYSSCPGAELCGDWYDNDCDGAIDMQDSDCNGACFPYYEDYDYNKFGLGALDDKILNTTDLDLLEYRLMKGLGPYDDELCALLGDGTVPSPDGLNTCTCDSGTLKGCTTNGPVVGTTCYNSRECDVDGSGDAAQLDWAALTQIINGRLDDGEVCDDTVDNNCDGLTDLDDPVCAVCGDGTPSGDEECDGSPDVCPGKSMICGDPGTPEECTCVSCISDGTCFASCGASDPDCTACGGEGAACCSKVPMCNSGLTCCPDDICRSKCE